MNAQITPPTLDIKYGTVTELSGGRNIGVRVALTNIFWKDEDGIEQWDACLLLMRKSFGVGRMNLTLQRKDAWLIREPAKLGEQSYLDRAAEGAALHLFGGMAGQFDKSKIADIILNNLDALVHYPPETQAAYNKRKQREMELDGLVIKNHDKVILDTR